MHVNIMDRRTRKEQQKPRFVWPHLEVSLIKPHKPLPFIVLLVRFKINLVKALDYFTR